MISKGLSAILSYAVKEARKRRHEYVCVEHILYAIVHDSGGIEIIESCGGNIENIQNELERFFNEKMERVPEDQEYVLQQTMRFQRVIQRAVNHARSAERIRYISAISWPPSWKKKIPMLPISWRPRGLPGWMC